MKCSRCGDSFDGPERSCPNPAPGQPYVDCGRGGHMFNLKEHKTMEYTEYCLGFVFDSTRLSVDLIKKVKGLHVGTWNGLGGKIETGETPLRAMQREYAEEANDCEIDEWIHVGSLQSSLWKVHIFTGIDMDCVDTYTVDDLLEQDRESGARVLLEGVERLPLAPHTLTLIAACLERLNGYSKTITIDVDQPFPSEEISDFADGDPYRAGAARVLGIDPQAVTREQRDNFKLAFFLTFTRRAPEIKEPELMYKLVEDSSKDILHDVEWFCTTMVQVRAFFNAVNERWGLPVFHDSGCNKRVAHTLGCDCTLEPTS